MKTRYLHCVLLVAVMSVLAPMELSAVHHPDKNTDLTQIEERPIDGLSLAGYASVVAGIASLFVVPALSLLLIPAGFVMGMIALFRGRDRFQKRRGRGLAIAAMIMGGVFSIAVAGSLIIVVLLGF